jgi:hypothetical protein
LKKSTLAPGVVEGSTASSGNDLNVSKKVGEMRRTSDGDISTGRTVAEKNVAVLNVRQPEPNGVRKDLVNQEKRRRLSLVDEKDLHLPGN